MLYSDENEISKLDKSNLMNFLEKLLTCGDFHCFCPSNQNFKFNLPYSLKDKLGFKVWAQIQLSMDSSFISTGPGLVWERINKLEKEDIHENIVGNGKNEVRKDWKGKTGLKTVALTNINLERHLSSRPPDLKTFVLHGTWAQPKGYRRLLKSWLNCIGHIQKLTSPLMTCHIIFTLFSLISIDKWQVMFSTESFHYSSVPNFTHYCTRCGQS